MTNKVNMLTLLKLFAQRQNHALISFAEFCAYMQYYAQRHLHEMPELVIFLKNTESTSLHEVEEGHFVSKDYEKVEFTLGENEKSVIK